MGFFGTQAAAQIPRWQFSDTDTQVILVGLINPVVPGTNWTDPQLTGFLAEASALMVDVAPSDATPDQVNAALEAYGLLGPRNQLSAALPPDLYTQLRDILLGGGFEAHTIDQYRPWLAATYARTVALNGVGYKSSDSVEQQMIRFAGERSIPVFGLETFAAQAQQFRVLSLDEETQMVQATLAGLPRLVEDTKRATTLWLSGDAEGSAAIMRSALGDTPSLQAQIFDARATRWMPAIKALLERPGRYVVALNIGFLVGERGVISNLLGENIPVIRLAR